MCRRFETIPACDGRTDGIAVANTALAMLALRRAVKTTSVSVTVTVMVTEAASVTGWPMHGKQT